MHDKYYQSKTAKTIYCLKSKKYNIIVQRYLLEKSLRWSKKDSLCQNIRMGYNSKEIKSGVPIYSIYIDELKVVRKNHGEVGDYFVIGKSNITIRCVGFNGKDATLFFSCRHLKSLFRLLSTRSRVPTNRLKGIIGRDIYDYSAGIILLLKLLNRVSKYDLDRVISVIRRDYYKTLRDYHRLIL